MEKITKVIRRTEQIPPALADVAEAVIYANEEHPLRITVEPYKKKRSLSQNALYWMWIDLIKKHISDVTGQVYSNADIHEMLRDLFLPKKTIIFRKKTLVVPTSTTELSVADFTVYLEDIDQYCADRLNLQLPHPEDIYHEAIGVNR